MRSLIHFVFVVVFAVVLPLVVHVGCGATIGGEFGAGGAGGGSTSSSSGGSGGAGGSADGCVCRCGGDDPFGHGCVPAWYVTGEAVVPEACTSCGDPGEQAWICEDAQAPPDCARLGDAPFSASGFYCCGCTQ